MQQNNESWKNLLRSMIKNLVLRIYCGIKFEDYKNDWNLLRTRESPKILTHRSVQAVPTFLIKLVFTRLPESLAANRECSEIHERI